LIEDKPKCLLDIKGRTILERAVAALNECNIKEIALIRGYKKEAINLPNIKYYDNDRYEETGDLFSFFCAENEMTSRTLFLYGDIVFGRRFSAAQERATITGRGPRLARRAQAWRIAVTSEARPGQPQEPAEHEHRGPLRHAR
jgi:choline kinase